MNAIVETITPAKAQEYLFLSEGNRPISKTTVRSYADTMKAGNWMLNGIPVVFDTEGHLIDGHHRLNAIIQAGIPIQTAVVRGIEKKAFATFDCGLHRTLGQLLAMQQKKNYNTVGSIVLASETLRIYGRLWPNNAEGLSKRQTNLDSYEIYAKDSKGYDHAGDIACDFYRKANVLRKSWIGSIFYHLTTIGGYNEEVVYTFFDNLCSLSESEYTSIELLRKRIIGERMRGVKIDTKMLFALLVKSWNAYIQNSDLKRLVYNDDTEKDYPTLKLNTK